ncbi:hypothetical protein C4565_00705 [Candidatus Parcubacteria bacterium]|nr:MAG: hypothetical protein C4565_00705 [Candidatus Parcubacteria bacterium]
MTNHQFDPWMDEIQAKMKFMAKEYYHGPGDAIAKSKLKREFNEFYLKYFQPNNQLIAMFPSKLVIVANV